MKQSFILIFTLLFCISIYAVEIDYSPLKKDDVGFILYDCSDGKEIFSVNKDKNFSYASNLKLVTTAAALEYLGGGFRFITLFLYEKESGTLYIKSAGNPSMVMEDMWDLSNQLKIRGVKKINKIVVDDFFYDSKGYLETKKAGKGDNAYLAYISPLSVNYNAVEIDVVPTETGEAVSVSTPTPGSHFIVSNSAKTVDGTGNNLMIGTVRNGNKTEIVVKGTLGKNRTKPVVVYKKVLSPTHHYIDVLLSLGKWDSNISVERKHIAANFFSSSNGILYKHKSKPLRDILQSMNRYSSNFLAECLQIFMGSIIKGRAEYGVLLLKDYIKKVTGMDEDPINGSGLGNGYNNFPPEMFMKLLKYVHSKPLLAIDFFSSLPVMGEDGTLKQALGGESNGSIRAKTGTLTSVAALSGIMKGKSGKLYLFTFVVNNFPTRNFKTMWAYRDKFMEHIWEEY